MIVYEFIGENIFMSWMERLIFQQMKVFSPLHECKTFIIDFVGFI